MQSLDMYALDRLDKAWHDLLRRLPALKQTALQTAGTALLQEVRRQVGASGMRDGGTKVAGWQRKYLGSKGGYVAIRSIGSAEGGGVGKDSAGAITNYTELGHGIRRPRGEKRSRYRPRIHVPAVSGYHFYYNARQGAGSVVGDALEPLKRQIIAGLGGDDT